MAGREDLTDEQWAILEPLIVAAIRRPDGRGRLQLHSDHAVLNGILWALRTGLSARASRTPGAVRSTQGQFEQHAATGIPFATSVAALNQCANQRHC
jgi:transposase